VSFASFVVRIEGQQYNGMMLFLLLIAAAPVTAPAASGTVDWSAGTITVTARSTTQTGAWKDRRLQEQDALDNLQPLVTAALESLCVSKGVTGEDLLARPGEIGEAFAAGVRGWEVAETRYFEKGGVEMDARIELAKWLGPVRSKSPVASVGLIVDARGLEVSPCAYPIVDAAGRPLWSVSDDALSLPALYVSDPQDPRVAARVGAKAPTLRATGAAKGSFTIDPAHAAAVDAQALQSRLLVVLVDP
jgi:hypothetical protein